MRSWPAIAGLVGLGLTTSAGPAAGQEAAAAFYRGRTITLVVGASAGGGVDLFGRMVARHLGRHIPGNPAIVVSNMPGAGSGVAARHLYNLAPRDGTHMALVLPGALTQQLLQPRAGKAAEYDPRQFSFVGNGNAETQTCVVRTDATVKRYEDVFTHELVLGTPGGGSTVHEHTVMAREILGARIRIVTGYPGTREIVLAAQRGEVQGLCGFSYMTAQRQLPGALDGSQGFRIIVQDGAQRHAELDAANVPLIVSFAKSSADREVLETFHLQSHFSRAFIMPPQTPAERLEAVRAAFLALLTSDRALAEEAGRLQVETNAASGAELERMVARMYATPAAVLERIRKALAH